jgi:hypothetical protein
MTGRPLGALVVAARFLAPRPPGIMIWPIE